MCLLPRGSKIFPDWNEHLHKAWPSLSQNDLLNNWNMKCLVELFFTNKGSGSLEFRKILLLCDWVFPLFVLFLFFSLLLKCFWISSRHRNSINNLLHSSYAAELAYINHYNQAIQDVHCKSKPNKICTSSNLITSNFMTIHQTNNIPKQPNNEHFIEPFR